MRIRARVGMSADGYAAGGELEAGDAAARLMGVLAVPRSGGRLHALPRGWHTPGRSHATALIPVETGARRVLRPAARPIAQDSGISAMLASGAL